MIGWRLLSKRALMLTALVTLLSACGEELQVSDDSGQEDVIASGTPFAFVSRDSRGVQDALSTNSLQPSAFNPGARLYVRSAISSEAADVEILNSVFGDQAYDVKDLSVSLSLIHI